VQDFTGTIQHAEFAAYEALPASNKTGKGVNPENLVHQN
jgi:hypothetical protein